MRPITTVLIEPQAIFLRGLEHDLQDVDDINVIGTAMTGKDGITLVHELRPMVAVIAVKLEDMPGQEVIEALSDSPATALLVLTQDNSEHAVCECMMAGAQGYVLKWDAALDLPEAIRTVNRGQMVISSASLAAFVAVVRKRLVLHDEPENNAPNPLTVREREVVRLMSEGLNQLQIAEALTISLETVKSHRRNIYTKLGVANPTLAVQEAVRRGVINQRR